MPGTPYKTFTPAFEAAFSGLTSLAHTTPEQLVNRHKYLAPQQRLTELKQLIQGMNRTLSPSIDAVDKMTAFLRKLNEFKEVEGLAAALDAANAKQTVNEKFERIKALFNDAQTQAAIAAWWNQYLGSQNSNKIQDMWDVLDRNSADFGKGMSNLDSQGDYDPTKKLVRDILRVLYMLFDFALISAGHKAVFAPSAQQDEGRLDTKTNLRSGPSGVRPPSYPE